MATRETRKESSPRKRRQRPAYAKKGARAAKDARPTTGANTSPAPPGSTKRKAAGSMRRHCSAASIVFPTKTMTERISPLPAASIFSGYERSLTKVSAPDQRPTAQADLETEMAEEERVRDGCSARAHKRSAAYSL